MDKERPLFEEEMTERSRRSFLILEILRRKGPLSRADISKASGINPVTISHYLDRLIAQNIVYEKEYDTSSGGRPPMLLDINSKAAYSFGIGVNLFSSIGVITDLEGKVVYKYKREKPTRMPNEIIDTVLSIGEELFNFAKGDKEKVRGIGVGIGGVVDNKKGVIRWPQKENGQLFYSYISMPLKGFLEEKFGIPVFIGNDANLACFAEYWLSLDPEVKNVIYMFSGVGCGMMINGELYTGNDGCAGELFINSQPQEEASYLGSYSFFKQWSYDLGLVERTRKVLNKETAESVHNLDDVFSWAGKDAKVKELINEAARALGIKIAMLINIFNPQVVIIGGGLEKGGFDFVESIYKNIKNHAFDEMVNNLKVVPSSLGTEAVALGAANLVVRNIFAYA
ncbi:MAG: ROK family transcriptional regulator [Candidatus Omnitrophica bacterium]|nr:ROK family transcriptional regulator [Candidatus Omnitrophota bacterium]